MVLVGVIGYYTYSLKISNGSATTPDHITIGWIGPLTGVTSGLGTDGLKAIQQALEQYNQSKKPTEPTIELVYADSPLGSKGVEPIYKDMVNNKKAKVIFIISSDDTKELANKALQDHVIIINPLNNDHTLANLNPNVFLIAKTTESLSTVIANLMLNKHEKKVMIVYSTNESFIVTLAKNFEGVFTANGGQAFMRPYSALAIQDFRPILAEGETNQVDAYMVMGDAEMGLAIKQARDMGIKKPIYSTNYITNPTCMGFAGEAINGTIFPDFTYLDGNQVLAKQFLNQFESKYHAKPHIEWTALQAYDAIEITILAIKNALAQEGNLTENIRKALLNITDYEGVSGNITINSDGTSKGIYPGVYIFKGGKAEKLQ